MSGKKLHLSDICFIQCLAQLLGVKKIVEPSPGGWFEGVCLERNLWTLVLFFAMASHGVGQL